MSTELTFKVTGTKDQKRAFLARHPVVNPTKLPVEAALCEMITNSADARASKINVVWDSKKGLFQVEDNGKGFGLEQQQGFLDLYHSVKEKEVGVTGFHGTGRTLALQFCNELRVHSVSEMYPKGTSTILSRQMLEELETKNAVEGEWKQGNLPSWWRLKEGQTGSVVELAITNPSHRSLPTEKTLLANLGRFFRLSVAEKVHVNGKRIADREFVAPPIRRIFGETDLTPALYAGLEGDVEVELWIPDKKGGAEKVFIGGDNPVYPLDDFIAFIGDLDVTNHIPEILREHSVAGVVYFRGLNKHVAENRKSLKLSLMTKNMHLHMIDFLKNVLGPILAAAYSKHETEQAKIANAGILESVVSDLNLGSDFEDTDGTRPPAPPRKKVEGEESDSDDLIMVNRKRVKLPLGDRIELRIQRLKNVEPANIEWMETTGGKEVPLSNEMGFWYVASGELGLHTVIVRDKKSPTTTVTQIQITVIEGKEFLISPQDVSIERGGSQDFGVKNHTVTSGKIEWAFYSNGKKARPVGLSLTNKGGLQTTVKVSATCKVDKYTLRATDTDNETVFTETPFRVKPGPPPKTLHIDDAEYLVRSSDKMQSLAVELSQQPEVWVENREVGTVEVNLDHLDFEHLAMMDSSSNARSRLIMEMIWAAHYDAEAAAGRIGYTEIVAKTIALRTKTLKMMAQKKLKN